MGSALNSSFQKTKQTMATRAKSHCFDAETLADELNGIQNTEYKTRANTKCFALMIDPQDSASNHHIQQQQQQEHALFESILSSSNLSDSELEKLKKKLNALQHELKRVKQQNHRAINKNVQLMNENELLRDELNKVKSSRSPSVNDTKVKTRGYNHSTLPLYLASSQCS